MEDANVKSDKYWAYVKREIDKHSEDTVDQIY